MQSSTSSDNQTAKRKHTEFSPETNKVTDKSMDTTELVNLIRNTINANLDERLKELPTKADLNEIKAEINSEVYALRLENKCLKEELTKVKKENEDNKRDIAWLENQVKSNKLFIKGLTASKSPIKEVENMFDSKLNLKLNIISARKIFERNEKMAVLVELESAQAIEEVFKNTRKLTGSSISIERDMIPNKQTHKRASLILRKQILSISRDHKIIIREDRLKINDRWFKWNKENKLMAGNSDGKTELLKLYGEKINSVNFEFDQIMMEQNPKN